ncbi:hypothetical protein Sipo8835_12540 [Streptomyces ipomoeae]|uniref:DUF4352 domain-containing protein n=1 Tax=Streptomyces ipomoeae TaxID=103232 RepID=A0AAE9B1M2_9ACTN|nr:hypothetical protein [Streptomyces ipomoeae]MDX2826473.1 hypothetical protein [Streptomyces ipomoeae]MDX2879151.1 hypothetical protein [Streptomyces ipomoeae]TQE19521.1 hypothetical protein Sipo7851_43720 [Streptomyces ipomoeae]TQE35689.1 hypothetical protein Sipo8835_12540 [Streptomyces ipomoeae]
MLKRAMSKNNRSSRRRAACTALAVTAALTGAAVTAAPSAAALAWKCKTSTKSIDQANYDGPWADNWDFKVKICAARSGGTVYSKASISWDGPVGGVDDTSIFDGAYFRLVLKKQQSGTDPVKRSKNGGGIEAKLENSDGNGNYNGSYSTGTISYKLGAGKGYSDGTLYLDWSDDGHGYQRHDFAASPVR